jgi:hypothetical protein
MKRAARRMISPVSGLKDSIQDGGKVIPVLDKI